MVIRFDRSFGRSLICLQIIYSITVKFFITVLHMPSVLNYGTDLINILLLPVIIPVLPEVISGIRYKSSLFMVAVYTAIVTLSAAMNFVSPVLFVWAIRNTFRFFVFFFACIVCLDRNDVKKIFKLLFQLHVLNVAVCLFEYFVLGCKQDYLGGLFGIQTGGNGGLNLYFSIMFAYALAGYCSGEVKFASFTFVVISTLVIAALSELKVFFVEVVLIAGIVFLLSGVNRKTLTSMVMVMAAGALGLYMLSLLFPEHFAILVSPEKLKDYIGQSYNSSMALSRSGLLAQINEIFFDQSIYRNLIGFGFGNCERSSFTFLTSAFAQQNAQYRYYYYTAAMHYLETGFTGLLVYILFFADTARYALGRLKHMHECSYQAVIVVIMSVLTVICMWYNQTLRTENAYIGFFALSLVGIYVKDVWLTEKAVSRKDGVYE